MRWRAKVGAGVVILLITAMAAEWAEAQGASIAVRAKPGQLFDESVVDQVRTLPNVTKSERFLVVKAQPNTVIGIEPGETVRIPSSDDKLLEGKIVHGRALRDGDKSAALVGPTVYREDYGFKGPMGMQHSFESGASFTFPDSSERIRVVGTFSVGSESEDKRVLLPVATAQRLFGASGKLGPVFS